jgi:hypothetical protein
MTRNDVELLHSDDYCLTDLADAIADALHDTQLRDTNDSYRSIYWPEELI